MALEHSMRFDNISQIIVFNIHVNIFYILIYHKKNYIYIINIFLVLCNFEMFLILIISNSKNNI